jgi:hypothetical protein
VGLVSYRAMNTHINIKIHGWNAEGDEFLSRLQRFLADDQPWSDDPNLRITLAIRATDDAAAG